jgi:hypothetical protein
LQKAQSHIKGRPAPHLGGEELWQRPGDVRGGGDHVEGTHAGGEERLVSVAHGGVGDEQGIGLAHPAGEALGAKLSEALLRARRRFPHLQRRQLRARVRRRRRLSMRAVDGNVGKQREQAARAVLARGDRRQMRALVYEGGVRPPG